MNFKFLSINSAYKMNKIYVLIFSFFIINKGMAMSYQQPQDQTIRKLIDQNYIEQKLINNKKSGFIKQTLYTMPSVDYLQKKVIKLAGLKIQSANLATPASVKSFKIEYFDFKTQKLTLIDEDDKNNIRNVQWSPNDDYISYLKEEDRCLSLWVYSFNINKKNKIKNICINGSMLNSMTEWISKDELLIKSRVNKNEIQIDEKVKAEPTILESNGVVSQNRTYSDLIKSTKDEVLFKDIMMSQYYILNVKKQTLEKFLDRGLWLGIQFSPDKKFVIAAELKAPFSKRVQYDQFARTVKVYNRKGKEVVKILDAGPFENIPIQGVRKGPRVISWNPQYNSSIYYVEAQDEGDWKNKVEFRDIVYSQEINLKGISDKQILSQVKNRFSNISFFKEAGKFVVEEYERDEEVVTSTFIDQKNNIKKIILNYGENDSYAHPGQIVEETDVNGYQYIVENSSSRNHKFIYLQGTGSSKDGDRPFLRSLNLSTLEVKELFRSETQNYEMFLNFVNSDQNLMLTSFQNKNEPPAFKLYKMTDDKFIEEKKLYQEENRFQILTQIKKELITYKRKDGLTLSGLLYYPLNYNAKKKYPVIIQAYPLEYVDAKTAGQVRGTQNLYEKPIRDDIIYHALRGYFVLDQAQMPIVGHPETKNDTFLEQLSDGASAAIDYLNKNNLIDKNRVGVMGHSYGAFMVANLLTHTKFFAAGVARSGAYNRTLTPFGFQGERRTLWQAKDVYLKLSPFLEVEKMKTPMLLIHGMKDENTGTFTIQSERYFDALKGVGAPARLVLLPEEGHGYVARENNEHVMWEMFNWFDKYLGEDSSKK